MLDFTKQINAYQERTQINTEVNERPLKNIGTRWNTRHRSFQRIPISFSLANVTLPAFAAERRCLQHGARSTPAVITRSLLPAAKGLAANEPASGRCFCRSMRQTDGRTDGRPTVIEPAAHTMRATSAPLKLRPYGAIQICLLLLLSAVGAVVQLQMDPRDELSREHRAVYRAERSV